MNTIVFLCIPIASLILSMGYLLCAYICWLRRLNRENRIIGWNELLTSSNFLQGTIIINHSNSFGRVWWTDREVVETEGVSAVHTFALLVWRPKLRNKSAFARQYPSLRIVEITHLPRVTLHGPERAYVLPHGSL